MRIVLNTKHFIKITSNNRICNNESQNLHKTTKLYNRESTLPLSYGSRTAQHGGAPHLAPHKHSVTETHKLANHT